ncbi:MAG: DUF6477 family protein [Roseovarius sp.]
MTDIIATLDGLQRPRLLIRAARHGAAAYRREMHLARHLDPGSLPDAETALRHLVEIEAEMEVARTGRHAHYAVARHLDVLIAIMGEARLLRASMAPATREPAQGPCPAPVS